LYNPQVPQIMFVPAFRSAYPFHFQQQPLVTLLNTQSYLCLLQANKFNL